MIDRRAFEERKCYRREPDEKIPDVPEGEHDQLPALVYGFELKSKTWQSFRVEETVDIRFDEKAWDHLVVDDDVKSLIKGLVDVTNNANTAQHLMSDVTTGKGGGFIAALHGPPGTGKTLTAEAAAKHLKRPLYIVSSPELSTTSSNFEHNALVLVALKVFEYHRGVLFLTTNRIQPFDDAFLSSDQISRAGCLGPAYNLVKVFELAGCECPLWGSESEGFVDVDGKEPHFYVSLSDLEALGQKPFNGRTIKNLVRTAQALALSA
ncbi:uncharacterized protein EDB91DRAFT_1243189 [Suillus paluster]|uniref:uncharacterized protein n=1 Tax=Suillus paluster TaxID=48578 RepID=UPI001B87CF57|nr:uncharacterized protein EDB91DRAFT_1243189 [Suillus paluster]KAG1752422.1 hypothetical protein EDB91DRAFT_1243189 [Suillus paluster]